MRTKIWVASMQKVGSKRKDYFKVACQIIYSMKLAEATLSLSGIPQKISECGERQTTWRVVHKRMR
jgi:hypothetical protein